MKKKSRKELAREIIESLRRGMNRPPLAAPTRGSFTGAVPSRPMPLARSTRPGQFQPSL